MRAGQRVVLHIGAMKTGTSFVQQVLMDNPAALAADGAVFPGGSDWIPQVRAARDAIEMEYGGSADDDVKGAWGRLLDTMGSEDATPVVSMEFLSFAGPDQAGRIVESLAPATVEVVLGVRDTGRVLPAQWQENTQNRGTTSWPQWCEGVTDPTRPHNASRRNAMRALRVPYMLEVWSALVPPERLHVVTVPPSGSARTLLWQRFAEAAGLSVDAYTMPGSGANEALGHVSADLMRRVNARVEDLPARAYIAVAKGLLAKQVLAARTAGEPKVVLPEALVDLAHRLDGRTVEAIGARGAQVHGDLADLTLRTRPDPEVVVVSDRQLIPAARYASRAMRDLATERDLQVPAHVAAGSWWNRLSGPASRLTPLVDDIEASVRAIGATLSGPRRRAAGVRIDGPAG